MFVLDEITWPDLFHSAILKPISFFSHFIWLSYYIIIVFLELEIFEFFELQKMFNWRSQNSMIIMSTCLKFLQVFKWKCIYEFWPKSYDPINFQLYSNFQQDILSKWLAFEIDEKQNYSRQKLRFFLQKKKFRNPKSSFFSNPKRRFFYKVNNFPRTRS